MIRDVSKTLPKVKSTSPTLPKVKVKRPTKRPPKKEVKLDVHGRRCPNCGEERVAPIRGDYSWGEVPYDDYPHENPFDCIRFLHSELASTIQDDMRREIAELRDEISELKQELAHLDAKITCTGEGLV